MSHSVVDRLPKGTAVTLQGTTLALVVAVGGMVWRNFDALDERIQAAQTQVAALEGKVDGLSAGIRDASDLRADIAELKESYGTRLVRCEAGLDNLRRQLADLPKGRRR